jgi:hypothetical protein
LSTNTETLPPGERAEDELSGIDAIAAMHDALVTVTKPADKVLTVRDVDFQKVGRWIVLRAKLMDGKTTIEFDVRMPKARAQSIRQRLTRVLG